MLQFCLSLHHITERAILRQLAPGLRVLTSQRAAVTLTHSALLSSPQDSSGQASRGQGFLCPSLRKFSAKHELSRGLITSSKYLSATQCYVEIIQERWDLISARIIFIMTAASPLTSHCPDFPPQPLTKIGMWGECEGDYQCSSGYCTQHKAGSNNAT